MNPMLKTRPLHPSDTRPLTPREMGDRLGAAIRFGLMMLASGAASFRTEEAMLRLAEHMGVARLEAYITPTGIIASLYSGDDHRTQIARLRGFIIDLNRVTLLEKYVRTLPPNVQPAEVNLALDAIEQTPPQYPLPALLIAAGVGCGSFAVIIGGGPLEFISAFVGASIAQYARARMVRAGFAMYAVTVVAAFFATLCSYLTGQGLGLVAAPLGLSLRPSLGIVSSVLLLVPGAILVSSVIDLAHYYLISGTVRIIYGILLIACIAIGMLLVLTWVGVQII
jgi:uncharacterized membrane protein YjjP (DUF1212 family)